MKHLFLVAVSLFFLFPVHAQEVVTHLPGKAMNYSSFSANRTYSPGLITQQGGKVMQHPELGVLPFNAACQDCYEQLDMRTADERHYKDIHNPSIFYIEKSARPSSFLKDGFLISIDPRMKPGNIIGLFSAPAQPFPVTADVNNGFTTIKNGQMDLQFNRLTLRKIYSNGSFTDEPMNWLQYTAGDNGFYITNAFHGVDVILRFVEAGVKSEFILHSPFPGVKEIRIMDALSANQVFQLVPADGSSFPSESPVEVRNESNQAVYTYEKVTVWDQSGLREHFWTGKMNTGINGKLEMIIDSVILSNPSLVYPLTIDPLVNAGPFAFAGTLQGSLLTPAFCSTSMTISFPGGSQPWDFSSSWDTRQNACCSGPSCWNGDARVNISSSCGGRTPVAPSWWACPACNTPGNWIPTIPFSSSGCQSVAQCYPASCLAQNMTFTFNHLRVYCADAGGCNCTWATNNCSRLQSWSVTVQGRTLEQSAAPSSSNGTTICLGTGTQLTASGSYGVPGYTYLWAPGGQTTQSIWVSPLVTTTYTCTITDACGVTASNQVTITVNTANTLPIPNIYSFMNPPSGNPCPVVVTFCSNEATGYNYGGGAETWQWSFPGGIQLTGGATSGSSNGPQYGGAGADATCVANASGVGSAYTVQYNTAGSYWASFTIFKGGSCAVRNIPIVICGTTPVELLYFNAFYRNGVVELQWETASETENDYFTVERSVDGETYFMIGILDGAGTSSQPHYYSMVDDAPPSGVVYYRLRQTDFDKTESYSEVRSVLVKDAAPQELTLIPNPASGQVQVWFYSDKEALFGLRILDVSGREVYSSSMEVREGGNNALISLEQLMPGPYMVEVSCNGKSWRKILIVR
ncbi:MAG: T9SS type A sorting domain-containing protein [Bacteroidia bacterium]|nr:T9SS type A sorting domain-containing protein [Bacteroidia bacterium]